jgi:hypothetical protein
MCYFGKRQLLLESEFSLSAIQVHDDPAVSAPSAMLLDCAFNVHAAYGAAEQTYRPR